MRRREPGPAELEALDPITGASLGGSPSLAAGSAPPDRSGRATRLRRVAILSAGLAVACAAAAGYFAVSILQLRSAERTWRTAMALDAARADADRQVRELLGDATGGEDASEALLAPLDAIGTEVAGRLRRHERALADRRIVDSKVSDLRDAMIEALEFRRFQLSPTRNRIGDTPLQQVERAIEAQLRRWDLAPARVEEPELRSLAPALAKLRRYADVATGATLFAIDGMTLHTIDVDRSTRLRRQVPSSGQLIGVPGGVAISDGRRVVIYPPDPADDPIAVIEDEDGGGNFAVPAGDGSGDLWVVQGGGATVRRFHVDGASSDWATDSATLPPNRLVIGSTFDHLVLDGPRGALELWSPTAPADPTTIASGGARFLDAEGSFVLFQGPLPFSPLDSSDFLHRFHAGTGRRDLIGLPRTDAASGAVRSDGFAAVVAGPLAGRVGAILLLQPDSTALTGGGLGPRASIGPGAVAWLDDGTFLFWLTPDGVIAMADANRSGTRQLLRTGLDGLNQLVAVAR